MIKIIYCPEGDAFSEFVVEEYIDNLVKMFKRNHFYPNEEKLSKLQKNWLFMKILRYNSNFVLSY